jgi:Cu2+-containing amine oxidase
MQVIHVDMYDKPASIPPVDVNYHTQLARETTGTAWRSDLQPINITQPQGPSFTVEGNMVRCCEGFGVQATGMSGVGLQRSIRGSRVTTVCGTVGLARGVG